MLHNFPQHRMHSALDILYMPYITNTWARARNMQKLDLEILAAAYKERKKKDERKLAQKL